MKTNYDHEQRMSYFNFLHVHRAPCTIRGAEIEVMVTNCLEDSALGKKYYEAWNTYVNYRFNGFK